MLMDGDISAEPLLLSREEAAETFSVSLPTVDRWIRSGGDSFVAEYGGNGRPYRIDAAKLKAWREGRVAEEAEIERQRQARRQQLEMELTGGAVGAAESELSAEQRLKVWQSELMADKLRRERGELVEVSRAEQAYEERLKLIADFLRSLPDALGRRLGWDVETTMLCAETIEGLQERVARMLIDERFLN
jgi:excisionase family DNA binding protein